MRHTRKRKCQTSSLTVQRTTLSYLPCSAWGLPCHLCHHKCGELLPHHFTLTELLRRYIFCCTFRRLLIPRNASSPLCYKARCSLEFGLSSPKIGALLRQPRVLIHVYSPRRILPQCSQRNIESGLFLISTIL